MVTEYRDGLRELDDGVVDVGALTAQGLRGVVHDRSQCAQSARFGRRQQLGEPLELLTQIVPFDWDGGALLGDDGAGLHLGAAGVGGRELDDARGHDGGGEDHRLGIGGHLVLAVEPEGDLHSLGLRFDAVDLADRDPEDADLVADEDAVAVGEVGHHRSPVRGAGRVQQHRDRGDDHQRERGGQARTEVGALGHWPAPIGGAGTRTGVGVGAGDGSAGGPGGGPPGGGAGSGSR